MINGLDLALPARIRIAALVGLMMLLSTAVELTGYFLSRPYSPYQVVWTRYVTHLLFLVIALAARRQLGLIRTRRLGLQIFRALLMLGMPAQGWIHPR